MLSRYYSVNASDVDLLWTCCHVILVYYTVRDNVSDCGRS